MSDDSPEFAAALREVLESESAPGSHIEPGVLVGYRQQILADAEMQSVREHLSQCRECADLFLELSAFLAAEPTGDGSTRAMSEAAETDLDEPPGESRDEEIAWQAIRERLELTSSTATEVAPVRPSPTRPSPTSWRSPLGLALAATLLLVIGLGFRLVSLENQIDQLRAPLVNVAIVHLRPPGLTREALEESTIRGEGKRFVLVVTPPSFPDTTEHSIEIVTPDGDSVWTVHGLWPTRAGTFDLVLDRYFVTPGEYRVRLRSDGKQIAIFDLRVLP